MKKQQVAFTGYQKFVVALLAFLQFTIILDFMIMAPLGAMLMPALNITPAQFSAVVSAYAFSAGISGLLAAGFADRFDRKKMLLFFYFGFLVGTLLCGIAPNYEFLLLARIVTGLFGGVIGSIVFAITTDLFDYSVRGRVMGFVQTAFAASQVLGIPLGLYFSNHMGWHAPFLMIVAVSAGVGGIIWMYLKPIDGHLKIQHDKTPMSHLWHTISTPRYIQAFATTALLSTGGFMLMPFGSAFSVHNLGVDLHDLPLIYVISGIFSIITGPMIGRLCDSVGSFRMFVFGSILTSLVVGYYTRLGTTPFAMVIAINVVMFIGIASRMTSSSILMSAVPTPENRGSFMSINSSLQQMAGGIGSVIAGAIVLQAADGHIEHFDTVGDFVIGASCITLVMMYFISRMLRKA